jgi:hypothetical protein
MREGGDARPERLLAIRDEAAAFTDDWLLRVEVEELLPPAAKIRAEGQAKKAAP